MQRFPDRLATSLADLAAPAVITLALFCIGVTFGALAAGSLGEAYRETLVAAISQLFQTLRAGATPAAPARAFGRLISGHAELLLLFWLFGVTVVGALAALLLVFLRGFAAGFAAAFITGELGWRGIVYATAALLPHSLIEVPGFCLAGAAAVHFARQVLSGRARRTANSFYRELGTFTRWTAVAAGLLLVAAAVEAFVTPWIMRLAAQV